MSVIVQHPRAVELIARKKLRKQVARAVSRLIAVLDELDTDPDLEPTLAAPEPRVSQNWTRQPQHVAGMDQRHWSEGGLDDREHDNSDDEPPLGWTPIVDQERAMRGCQNDTGEEGEPSLGAPEHRINQTTWASGNRQDLEFGGDVVADENVEDDDPGDGDILDERHDGDLGWHGNMDQSDLVGSQVPDTELDPTDCIERGRPRREWTMSGPTHERDAERQALALKRRLSSLPPEPAGALSECRLLTEEEMVRMMEGSR